MKVGIILKYVKIKIAKKQKISMKKESELY